MERINMIINKDEKIIRYINKNNSYIEERIKKSELNKSELENRRKISFIIKMNDMRLRKEDIYNKNNICPHCMMIKSYNGTCGC